MTESFPPTDDQVETVADGVHVTESPGNDGDQLAAAGAREAASNIDAGTSVLAEEENEAEQNATPVETAQEEDGSDDAIDAMLEKFISKHEQWKTATLALMSETAPQDPNEPSAQGRPAIVEAMYSNKQVQLHSLTSSPDKNGLVGKVVSYSFKRDRFHVETTEGNTLALNARNLKVISDESGGVDNMSDKEPLNTTAKLAEALFQPGMLFAGQICIPGLLSDTERKGYQLIVESSSSMDELDRPMGILARHKAYDDEQYVRIQVELDDTTDQTSLSIRYADGETQCHGKWNDEKGLFEGTVRQLLPTQDGGSVYHTQDKVSHTFTLTPTTALYPNGIATMLETNQEARLDWKQDLKSPLTLSILRIRQQIQQWGFDLVNMLHRVCQNENILSVDPSHPLIGQVDWQDIMFVNFLSGEKICAKFRCWASLVDSFSFESLDERTGILASLQAKGITRALAHAESDECKESARDIFAVWCNLSSLGRRMSGHPDSEDMTRMLSICARLERNFDRFDGALRRAEERLTNADISSWIAPLLAGIEGEQGDGAVCSICHVELLGDEMDHTNLVEAEVLRLPCSHEFHGQCLREWLHHHSQCPMCRCELNI